MLRSPLSAFITRPPGRKLGGLRLRTPAHQGEDRVYMTAKIKGNSGIKKTTTTLVAVQSTILFRLNFSLYVFHITNLVLPLVVLLDITLSTILLLGTILPRVNVCHDYKVVNLLNFPP